MSSLRALLRRKSKSSIADPQQNDPYGQSEKADTQHETTRNTAPPMPAVQIMRSTTYSQELLTAPSFSPAPTMAIKGAKGRSKPPSASLSPQRSNTVKETGKRLSSLLHLSRRPRSASITEDVPRLQSKRNDASTLGQRQNGAAESIIDRKSEEERQAKWEKRATMLVEGTTVPVSLPSNPVPVMDHGLSFDALQQSDDWPLRSSGSVHGLPGQPRTILADRHIDAKSTEQKSDDDIQQAIQLHESGNLSASTTIFGRLADPAGANNALAQVLYGLALRHGWGITPDPELAIQYLTYSARNASNLTSSLAPSTSTTLSEKNPPQTQTQIPASKRGELTLAIYELGNCHRNGWGVAKSPALAMQYFETAAELGDADAMIEVAMACEKGVKGWQSGKKDRAAAARWYRRAERAGRREVGNSWIWKEKYDDRPPPPSSATAMKG